MEGIKTGNRQLESAEEIRAQIERLEAKLAEKLNLKDVDGMKNLMDLSDEEKNEPTGWGKIQESYDRASNAINAVGSGLTAGSLMAFIYAISQRVSPFDITRVDPDVFMQAVSRFDTAAMTGATAAYAAAAVFILGHAANSINKRIKEGF